MSLLGLVRHLADVERGWFRRFMAGEDAPPHFRDRDNPNGDFDGAVADPEIVAQAWETWRVEIDFADRFVAEAPVAGSHPWTRCPDTDMIGVLAVSGEELKVKPMSRGGRDQLGPIERLVRVLAVLDGAGPAGATQEQLLQVAQYGGDSPDAQRRMLNRDISHLNDAGWDIQNVADVGTSARYVLQARDIRLRVELSPGEQAELARVGRVAGVEKFAEYVGTDADGVGLPPGQHDHLVDVQLTLCLEAAARRRVVQFIYKGRARTVHPRVVEPGPSGWYLAGWERGSGVEKRFVVDRMRNVVLDQPGTATAAPEERRGTLDPATWDVDPPVDVELEATSEFADQVKLALRPVVDERVDGDNTVLTVRVTNRAAFRMRLYTLGARVRVLGPDEVRAEIVDELTRLAGEE